MDAFDGVEISTGESPVWSVIWLHGLGADGHDFAPIVPELVRPEWPAMRFVFPHAPVQRVTINNGLRMRAWYDILSLDASPGRREDERGLRQAYATVHDLIGREIARGVQPAHILLAGFSQGGAVAYATALSHPEKLAGVIALSTYIPNPAWLAAEATDANTSTPIFAAHGSDDDVVAPVLGLAAREFLVQRGYPVEWHDYAMPHSVCIEEIGAIGQWLRRIMAGLEAGSERGGR